jgi:hypothetical protein
MAGTHISITELPPKVQAMLHDLPSGEEIVIDSQDGPVAIVRAPDRLKSRTITELIARFEERERELGHPLRMGADFADDLENIIADRKPRDARKWD